jgi:hypothetical protein
MNWLTDCFGARKTESIFSFHPEFPLRNSRNNETGFRRIVVRSRMRCSPLIAMAALLLFGCDVVTSRYATLDDARRDRLFERGWLPDILPPSTRDIRVSNNVDVNTSEGEFSFDPAEFPAFADQLQVVGKETFQFSSGQHSWKFSCHTSRGFCRYSLR